MLPITRTEVLFQIGIVFVLLTIVLVGLLYMLVYGRLPRGPLAVLKESWTRQRDVGLRVDIGRVTV